MKKTTVCFATDKKYMYFTGVTLQSLLDHISPDIEYLIVILNEELDREEEHFFHSMIEMYSNVSLRMINMTKEIDKVGREKFFVGGRYPISAYYRLFLPEILTDIDRIVYLDSDMLVLADIAKLASIDLHGYALGAVLDKFSVKIPVTCEQWDFYLYCHRTLHLKDSSQYLNSGMLILDLDLMRRTAFKEKVQKALSTEIPFLLVDQDIFNMIYEKQYYIVDSKWNDMMHESKRDHSRSYIQHFSNLAPWSSEYKPYAKIWREYAEKQPYWEEIQKKSTPFREKHLNQLEIDYYTLINSTCWKITAPIRRLFEYIAIIKRILHK